MKKLINIFILPAALAAFCSCADLLETESKSSFDESIVFSNYDLAEPCNYGITQALLEKANHRGRFHPYAGLNSDIEWANLGDTPGADWDVYAYNLLATNTTMNTSGSSADAYSPYYSGIERANLNIRNLRKYGNVASDKDMAFLLGEALTLRAVLYYDLLRTWGDVPFRTEPISDDIYIPKSNRDVIYKQILADLEEAYDYLPWPGQGHATSTDRVSLAFAKALYARLALMASGYAQRPDDDKVGTGDAGTIRLSNDPELSKSVLYPKALAACKDVIANSGCSLYTNYEQLWKDLNNFDRSSAGTGREVLWIFPYGDLRGRWNYSFAVRHAGMDQYVGSNAGTGNRGGQAGPVPSLYFDYGTQDTRRDVSCVNFRWEKPAGSSNASPILAGINNWYFGKYRFEWMINSPYNGGNDDGFKPVYMRLSDVYLMAAECANELTGFAEAKTYLLPVRQRAYKGNESAASTYVNSITSKQAMFDAIVLERGLEFVGEMTRKTDLIRWNLLKSKMDESVSKMEQLGKMEGQYAYLAPGQGYVYYKVDGTVCYTYGLDPGQPGVDPGAGWTEYTDSSGAVSKYVTDKNLTSEKVGRIYKTNPDTRQYWPIFQSILDSSQGMIKNDYGY